MGKEAFSKHAQSAYSPIPAVKSGYFRIPVQDHTPFRLARMTSLINIRVSLGQTLRSRILQYLSDGHSPARSCFIMFMYYSGRIGYINHGPHFVVLGELAAGSFVNAHKGISACLLVQDQWTFLV